MVLRIGRPELERKEKKDIDERTAGRSIDKENNFHFLELNVEAYTNQEFDIQLPKHNLPSQILCRVVYMQLKEEVSGIENAFLKRHADACLPVLDMSQQQPSQELVARDLHRLERRFRHVYRELKFQSLSFKGSFVHKGENGELRVGVRRAMETQQNPSSSVISFRSMQLGVLATASHVISTGTMFSVYYLPRMSPSEFLIPYDEYMRSVRNKYSIGLRFRMKFEGEEGPKQRIVGTIVGIDDVDPVRWPRSKWRCLTVTWDEPCLTVVRPKRVSPWTIELSDNARTNSIPVQLKTARRVRISSSADSSILDDG
ncbi:hypothetical protein C5167_034438 [Papaver somniferum]|uniref:Auxin response factor domain-containing protein n=1 Tax=Papaver somniferum TaxID=3469 RepID=A0A4Y7KEJ4_PAPSO|nr:hypothetical protein C5167_034438 [Papaver somniferum]